MNDHISETEVLALKALLKRKRPAPFCNSFLFINNVIIKSNMVTDLVERGLIIKIQAKPEDIESYDLTSDGIKLAEKLS